MNGKLRRNLPSELGVDAELFLLGHELLGEGVDVGVGFFGLVAKGIQPDVHALDFVGLKEEVIEMDIN
jgi:hypothetical protein